MLVYSEMVVAFLENLAANPSAGATAGRIYYNTVNNEPVVRAAAAFKSICYADLTNLSGTVPVTKGGTGLVAGTSGGVPYFSATTTMASSGALTAAAIVLGGGAGASPTSLALGTANQLLGMTNAATGHEYKTLALGTTAQSNDLGIVHAANSVTVHIPSASITDRGVVTAAAQSFLGIKSWTSGIKLGATTSTLLHYEETNWTPVAAFSGTNTPIHNDGSGRRGRITRIGNRIFFQVALNFDKNGSTTTLTITGLPNATSNINAQNQYGIGCIIATGATPPLTYSTMVGVMQNNSSVLGMFWQSSMGAGLLAVDAATLSANTILYVFGSYETT